MLRKTTETIVLESPDILQAVLAWVRAHGIEITDDAKITLMDETIVVEWKST